MRICFVMPGSHLILLEGRSAGGAELQMVRLARGLQKLGDDVTFITANPGGRSAETIDGFRVVPALPPHGSGPLLFFRTWHDLRKALDATKAAVWIQRSASPLTGLMARHARKRGVAFVYMISNDSNVDGRYEARANWRDRWLYREGLRLARGIVAQTETQARLLRERAGRESMVLPSAIPASPEPPPEIRPEQVFWAASFQPHKRPHLLLDLARRAPDLSFAVAGFCWGDVDYGRRFEEQAKSLPNVRLLGRLDPVRMDAEYRRSIALLSTSEYEGVSNTFLEAWRLGVPVVSLKADPDEVICAEGLGLHSDDLDRVTATLRRYRDDARERARIAAAARRYLGRHDENAVAARLSTWLRTLVDQGGAEVARERA